MSSSITPAPPATPSALYYPPEMEAAVWRTIIGAGSISRFPPLNSTVFYFPQGHSEQQQSTTSTRIIEKPLLFYVKSITFHCHPWDELFAQFSLIPLSPDAPDEDSKPKIPASGGGGDGDGDIIARATPCSAIFEDGSFHRVPTEIAEAIFPPEEEDLTMVDVLGNTWKFGHVYSEKRNAHYLTRGWRVFVIMKNLNSADTVVFMRRQSTGELLIGIRRIRCREDFVSTDDVPEWQPLVVNYYGMVPAFVVSQEVVVNGMSGQWLPGCRLRMLVDAMDLSKVEWQEGKVTEISMINWPWKMLKVSWDTPLMNSRRNYANVNHWDVEICQPAPDN